MATATQSTTLMTRNARSYPVGTISESFRLNTGAVTASGATLIQLAKIPVGATITDVYVFPSCGSLTCPVDVGISGLGTYQGASTAGTISTFVGTGTGNAIARATKGLPWTVTCSDDATVRFATLSATVTPGTATVSLEVTGTVFYTLDA